MNENPLRNTFGSSVSETKLNILLDSTKFITLLTLIDFSEKEIVMQFF